MGSLSRRTTQNRAGRCKLGLGRATELLLIGVEKCFSTASAEDGDAPIQLVKSIYFWFGRFFPKSVCLQLRSDCSRVRCLGKVRKEASIP